MTSTSAKTAREKVRIDWRKDADSEFIDGPEEDAGAMSADDVRLLNDVLGWEKYRIVNVTSQEVAEGEESGERSSD